MPELPEVETTVRDLNKKIINRKIQDVWTDWPKLLQGPKAVNAFRREVNGRRIQKVQRMGKMILIHLTSRKTILIHQKLSGHLLFGRWGLTKQGWKPISKGPLGEKMNRFIHLLFFLDNGEMWALSDLRKFAKVLVLDSNKLGEFKDIKLLGPDALDVKYDKFKEQLGGKRGKIKQILMDQEVIAGIGNIYSDEILWAARAHPFKRVEDLRETELKNIFKNIKPILTKAIKLRGDSTSDYRDIKGEKGHYQEVQKVYRQEGKPCPRCGAKIKIKRAKIGGRSAHFCPKCQV